MNLLPLASYLLNILKLRRKLKEEESVTGKQKMAGHVGVGTAHSSKVYSKSRISGKGFKNERINASKCGIKWPEIRAKYLNAVWEVKTGEKMLFMAL